MMQYWKWVVVFTSLCSHYYYASRIGCEQRSPCWNCVRIYLLRCYVAFGRCIDYLQNSPQIWTKSFEEPTQYVYSSVFMLCGLTIENLSFFFWWIFLIYVKTSCQFLSAVPKNPIKFDGVRRFSFSELETATDNFNMTTQIGRGAYGKVYKGILADGLTVAVKRAYQGSLQGEKEFFTEIEFLSRLHHRNLVSLVGYCDDESEQV